MMSKLRDLSTEAVGNWLALVTVSKKHLGPGCIEIVKRKWDVEGMAASEDATHGRRLPSEPVHPCGLLR